MGKGGRYLRRAEKKKTRGLAWKIPLAVLAILVVMVCTVAFVPPVRHAFSKMILSSYLGQINRAEMVDQNISGDDFVEYIENFNPDKPKD